MSERELLTVTMKREAFLRHMEVVENAGYKLGRAAGRSEAEGLVAAAREAKNFLGSVALGANNNHYALKMCNALAAALKAWDSKK